MREQIKIEKGYNLLDTFRRNSFVNFLNMKTEEVSLIFWGKEFHSIAQFWVDTFEPDLELVDVL